MPIPLRLCSDNYVGAVGAGVLAAALRQNESLQVTYMTGGKRCSTLQGLALICGVVKYVGPDRA
jgi:hypothetical protein